MAGVIFVKDSIGSVRVIFAGKARVQHSVLVHNNLSEILSCVVGGWGKSVRFTLMSGGDLTYLAGLDIS